MGDLACDFIQAIFGIVKSPRIQKKEESRK